MSNQNNDRTVLAITGADRQKFLQDLVTNDVSNLGKNLVYAALLSPKGKYLFDFFLFDEGDVTFLDIQSDRATALAARLGMYKLRADVTITPTDTVVSRGVDDAPIGAKTDPRHATLGWRYYGHETIKTAAVNWPALRVAACVPKTGTELIAEDTYILEAGFEHLHGVDFVKGCYVGQEITARMKHKTKLRKGLSIVTVTGSAPVGTPIMKDGRTVGTLMTTAGTKAIAYLRYDRAGPDMTAGDAQITWSQ